MLHRTKFPNVEKVNEPKFMRKNVVLLNEYNSNTRAHIPSNK